jgi:hypothetical protein
MMIIENKFNIGETVYLVTDEDQKPRIVTGINVTANGLRYNLVNGITDTYHYELEMSSEKNILTKITE